MVTSLWQTSQVISAASRASSLPQKCSCQRRPPPRLAIQEDAGQATAQAGPQARPAQPASRRLRDWKPTAALCVRPRNIP